MSKRALVALVGGTVVGTVVLTGCQSNPKPPPLDSASKSPSPSESPTPAAPTLPPEAKGTSEAAAKALVRHWIDVLNYAAATGDAAPLRDLSRPACSSCAAITRNIDRIYSAGGEIRSGGWNVNGIRVIRSTRTSAVLSLDMQMGPQAVVSAKGEPTVRNEGARQPMTMFLAAVNGIWRVARLDLVL